MPNYLNKILLSLLIIMVPYMNSASKAMDDEEGSTVHAHTVSLKPMSSINLEDSQTSWTSYFLSPAKSVVKNTFKNTCEIIDFATQSRNKTILVSLWLASKVLGVAAQFDCLCGYSSKGQPVTPFLTIPLNDPSADCLEVCQNMCNHTNISFLGLHYNYRNWSCSKHLN